jgi:hypothetical protein
MTINKNGIAITSTKSNSASPNPAIPGDVSDEDVCAEAAAGDWVEVGVGVA